MSHIGRESYDPISQVRLRRITSLSSLKACIFYLYTGKLNFLPFKSNGNATRQFALLTTNSNAPPCSPKSMYRLAEAVSEVLSTQYHIHLL